MKRSPLLILFITVVIDLLGFGIIMPLLPLYVDRFGGREITAGWLATSFSVMQFLFAPIWGRISDIKGRRPLILLSLAGSALAFFLFGVAQHLWVLFVARIAAGILTAASLPAAYAYIADVTPPERRARGMAMIGVAFGIGFACGPMLGGWLGRQYGLAVPAFVVAGMAAANFVWSWFALPESLPADRNRAVARRVVFFDWRGFQRAYRSPLIGELFTVFAFSTFAFAMMESTFTWVILRRFVQPTFAAGVASSVVEKAAAGTAGSVFVIVGVAAVLAQGAVMGGLAQRFGDARLIRAGSILLAATLWGIGFTTSLVILKVLAAGLAVGSGMTNPALSSLVSRAADPAERGSVMGVQQGLGSLARMVAPLVGTDLLQKAGIGVAYSAAAALMAIAFVCSLAVHNIPVSAETQAPIAVH
jgi:MFS transporter, DHA1 family, tetracycline resistance protein